MTARAIATVIFFSALLLAGCGSGSELTRDHARGILSAALDHDLTQEVILPEMRDPDEDLVTDALFRQGFISTRDYEISLSPVGEKYAAAHGWSHKSAFYLSADQQMWSIPYARLSVRDATGVSMTGDGEATVDYTYVVQPNDIGAEMQHIRERLTPDAYEVTGWDDMDQWRESQQATISLRLYNDGWRVEKSQSQ